MCLCVLERPSIFFCFLLSLLSNLLLHLNFLLVVVFFRHYPPTLLPRTLLLHPLLLLSYLCPTSCTVACVCAAGTASGGCSKCCLSRIDLLLYDSLCFLFSAWCTTSSPCSRASKGSGECCGVVRCVAEIDSFSSFSPCQCGLMDYF